MKKLILALLILMQASVGWGATETFYVCHGGDGTLPETATCATAYDEADFSTAGNWAAADGDDGKIGYNDDVVLLDDGGDFESTILIVRGSGDSGKPITIKAGSGETPRIKGSQTLSSWTDETGNIWSAAFDDETLAYVPVQVFFNETTWGDEKDCSVDKTGLVNAYDWCFIDADNKIYIYSTSDPSGVYDDIDAGYLPYGIQSAASQNYITITGLTFIHQGHGTQSASIYNYPSGSNWTVSNNNISYIGDNIAEDGHGILIGGQSSTVSYNTITETGAHSIYVYSFAGSTTSSNTIEHNTLSNSYHTGIDVMDNSTGVIDGTVIRYNTYYTTAGFTPQTDGAIYVSGSTGGVTNTDIYYNIVYGGDNLLTGIHIGVGGGDADIYNNTIYGIESGANYSVYLNNSASATNVKNNIGYTTSNHNVRCVDPTNKAFNDNIWYGGATGIAVVDAGTAVNDLGTWNALAYVDTDIASDPLFVAAGTNFRIRAGSPARDAGTDVSLTSDYIGTTVPQNTTQDIGAYEYPYESNAAIRKIKELLSGIGIQL